MTGSDFPIYDDINNLTSTIQALCRMFLNWNVTNVFLQLNKGYNVQDRKKKSQKQSTFSQRNITNMLIIVEASSDHLTDVFLGFYPSYSSPKILSCTP